VRPGHSRGWHEKACFRAECDSWLGDSAAGLWPGFGSRGFRGSPRAPGGDASIRDRATAGGCPTLGLDLGGCLGERNPRSGGSARSRRLLLRGEIWRACHRSRRLSAPGPRIVSKTRARFPPRQRRHHGDGVEAARRLRASSWRATRGGLDAGGALLLEGYALGRGRCGGESPKCFRVMFIPTSHPWPGASVDCFPEKDMGGRLSASTIAANA